jgi:hypothetical protein
MAIRERLIYAIDVVTDQAQKGLKNFRTSVAEAEGATGKFKAGASSAFSTIQANAGMLAVAGGAALVTFGTKAVAAFQETAIEAGKFGDATGLAVEDASRWIEVAGDVGVSAETMQGAFVKLNKAIGSGSPVLKEYGVGLITAADGTADVNQTMLTAIERIGKIEDPTKRAEAAQAAFGRSYAEAAEIIFDNADNVKKKLEEVSEQKVIDEKELEKARRFRKAMDDINDVVEDLTLVVGEGLVPALTDVAETATDIRDAFGRIPKAPWIVEQWWDKASPLAWQRHTIDGLGKVGGAIRSVFGGGGEAPVAFKATTTAADQYVESLEQMHAAAKDTAAAEADHADTLDKSRGQADSYISLLQQRGIKVLEAIAAATDIARKANKLFADSQRDVREATLESLDTMFDYEQATLDVADAVTAMNEAGQATDATMADVRRAQIDAAEAALDSAQAYATSKGAIEGSTLAAQLQRDELSRLAGKFPELSGLIQGYIDKLNAIPSVKSTQLVVTSSGAVTTKQTLGAGGRLVAGAEGAIVTRPTGALIGEAGPEAVIPLNKMPGASPLPGGMGGGGRNYTINLYGGQATPEAVVDAIKKFERLHGAGWRS